MCHCKALHSARVNASSSWKGNTLNVYFPATFFSNILTLSLCLILKIENQTNTLLSPHFIYSIRIIQYINRNRRDEVCVVFVKEDPSGVQSSWQCCGENLFLALAALALHSGLSHPQLISLVLISPLLGWWCFSLLFPYFAFCYFSFSCPEVFLNFPFFPLFNLSPALLTFLPVTFSTSLPAISMLILWLCFHKNFS